MAALIVVGCSAHPQAVPSPTHSIESPSSARSSTQTVAVGVPSTSPLSTPPRSASAVSSGLGHDHIVLKCDDSAGELGIGDSADNLRLGSATLTGLVGRQDPRLATEVGLKGLTASLYFRKTPLYIEAGAGPVTLTLLGQRNEFLSWVPASVWTGGTAPDLQPWAAKSVTFQGCADSGAMYLGGLLAADPNQVFQLTGSHAGHQSTANISLATGSHT